MENQKTAQKLQSKTNINRPAGVNSNRKLSHASIINHIKRNNIFKFKSAYTYFEAVD